MLISKLKIDGYNANLGDFHVSGLASDSREVKAGDVFFAISGSADDGEKYIPSAIEKGAKAIIVSTSSSLSQEDFGEVLLIKTSNVRMALSKSAAIFYDKQPSNIVAVTGTDGKTSTASFVRQLWEAKGIKAASIGTLGIESNSADVNKFSSTGHTTPDTISFHKMLTCLEAEGVKNLVFEASSHGLDQYRLHGAHVKAAGFTNIHRDHLDYHKTEEEYFKAKLKLFSEVLISGGMAAVNVDDKRATEIKEVCARRNIKFIGYGKNENANLRILELKPVSSGLDVKIEYKGKVHQLHYNLVGDFNVYNALCAVVIAAIDEDGVEAMLESSKNLKPVKGRMELASTHNQAAIYVDYAHTPNALETALKALRHHCEARLFVLFGCGGDRDAGKRPEMGKIASNLADVVIVTDDNPRSETPSEIRKQILDKAANAIEVEDRRKALEKAISMLSKGDILLVAGKGHENYQIIGKEVLHFDDVEEIKKISEMYS